eukprot:3935091-Lingulodinium_polyedra.AAC.1
MSMQESCGFWAYPAGRIRMASNARKSKCEDCCTFGGHNLQSPSGFLDCMLLFHGAGFALRRARCCSKSKIVAQASVKNRCVARVLLMQMFARRRAR